MQSNHEKSKRFPLVDLFVPLLASIQQTWRALLHRPEEEVEQKQFI